MAEVNQWIRGELNPPSSGEYYVVLEAQVEIPAIGFQKGDIEMQTDYFDTDRGEWDELGKDNPSWKVLAWADILRPDMPRDLRDRVKRYFGLALRDGQWLKA